MTKCREVGMENFFFEVVTDKAICLPGKPRLREVIVPSAYRYIFNCVDLAASLLILYS